MLVYKDHYCKYPLEDHDFYYDQATMGVMFFKLDKDIGTLTRSKRLEKENERVLASVGVEIFKGHYKAFQYMYVDLLKGGIIRVPISIHTGTERKDITFFLKERWRY